MCACIYHCLWGDGVLLCLIQVKNTQECLVWYFTCGVLFLTFMSMVVLHCLVLDLHYFDEVVLYWRLAVFRLPYLKSSC